MLIHILHESPCSGLIDYMLYILLSVCTLSIRVSIFFGTTIVDHPDIQAARVTCLLEWEGSAQLASAELSLSLPRTSSSASSSSDCNLPCRRVVLYVVEPRAASSFLKR